MKAFFEKIVNFFKSLFTDKEWDGDATKVFGAAIAICGIVGFFLGKSDFQWMIGFGVGAMVSGKFSNQG